MKSSLAILVSVFSLALLFSGAPASSAAPAGGAATAQEQQQDLAQRVAQLEKELAELRLQTEASNKRVEEAVVYLDKQAEGAKTILAKLTESESLGFTKGINYESREVLLAAFRSYWGDASQGAPKPAPKKKVD